MSIISFNEFIDRLNEYADKMHLGIRHTNKGVYGYVNLYPMVIDISTNPGYKNIKFIWEFIKVINTQPNFHIVSYVDENLLWKSCEYNDAAFPVWLLDKIKEQYPKAVKARKMQKLKPKLEEIEKDFK